MAKKKKKKKKKQVVKGQGPRGFKNGERVAIVGKGEGRGLAPRAPHSRTDIWGTNNVGLQQPIDMIFDMHDLEWTLEENYKNYDHLRIMAISDEERMERAKLRQRGFEALKKHAIDTGMPIMSLRKYAGVPGYAYPLEAIKKKFDCDMFSSVTPYMIALAIYKGYKYIDLYGINCAAGEEWAYQREAVTGWLMFAKGKGIKVTVNGGAGRPMRLLHPTTLYGFGIEQEIRGTETFDEWWEPAPEEKYKMADEDIDITKPKEGLVKRRFKVWRESSIDYHDRNYF